MNDFFCGIGIAVTVCAVLWLLGTVAMQVMMNLKAIRVNAKQCASAHSRITNLDDRFREELRELWTMARDLNDGEQAVSNQNRIDFLWKHYEDNQCDRKQPQCEKEDELMSPEKLKAVRALLKGRYK